MVKGEKMNIKKTFSKTLLMAMSLLSLAACGNSDNANTTSDNQPAQTQTQTAETTTEDANKKDSSTKEENSDKPDTWIADREIRLLVFESAGDTGEGTMSPEIAQYIKDRTGITLTIESVSNEDSYEALAAGLSSGDLPDAVAFYLDNSGRPEFPLLLKASNEGMFHDISEELKNTDIYGKYFEEGFLPRDTKENIMMRDDQDGATYLVHMAVNRKAADPGNKTIGGMYMRKDIAEDLGVKTDQIKSTEDMQDLLEKIKAGDYKDKNGNPVIPLGPTSWGGSDRSWPYSDMVWEGPGAQKFLKDGDKVKHESMTDYGEKRVAKVREWLEKGLMDPEYYTMEETRAQEGIQNESFAIVSDSHNYRPEIANGKWIPLGDLKRADGSDNMVMAYKSGYTGWAVPATTEKPEEVVKFADWMASKEGKMLYFYGLEGKHYDLVDGKPVPKKDLVELQDTNPDEAKKEGFRGVRAFWGEHFAYTDMDNLDDFGEQSWGDSVRGEGGTESQKIIEEYNYDKKYEDKEVIDGLYPRAYLFEFEGEDGNLSQALDDWNDALLKAYYAKSDEEAKSLLDQARMALEDAGINDFCKFLEDKEKEGDTIFY